jgi:hypothetical protein
MQFTPLWLLTFTEALTRRKKKSSTAGQGNEGFFQFRSRRVDLSGRQTIC